MEAFGEFRQLKSADDTVGRDRGRGTTKGESGVLQGPRCKRYLRGMSFGAAVSLIEIDYPEPGERPFFLVKTRLPLLTRLYSPLPPLHSPLLPRPVSPERSGGGNRPTIIRSARFAALRIFVPRRRKAFAPRVNGGGGAAYNFEIEVFPPPRSLCQTVYAR